MAALPGLLVGCAERSDDAGRSAVGVARRADGSVVVVTAWCLGKREEKIQISRFEGGDARELLYVARGSTSEPVTIHTVGHIDTLTPFRNRGLPTTGVLVAYNAGKRQTLFRQQAYPSTVAVFELDRLPLAESRLPRTVLAGDQREISIKALIGGKCGDVRTRKS